MAETDPPGAAPGKTLTPAAGPQPAFAGYWPGRIGPTGPQGQGPPPSTGNDQGGTCGCWQGPEDRYGGGSWEDREGERGDWRGGAYGRGPSCEGQDEG